LTHILYFGGDGRGTWQLNSVFHGHHQETNIINKSY